MKAKRIKRLYALGYLYIPFFMSCGHATDHKKNAQQETTTIEAALVVLDASATTITIRFSPPTGFERTEKDNASFSQYLRNLPLKPKEALVQYYDGTIKPNRGVYEAVIDLPKKGLAPMCRRGHAFTCRILI